MDAWKEGMEWIHKERGWNGYRERGDRTDTRREGIERIQGERR